MRVLVDMYHYYSRAMFFDVSKKTFIVGEEATKIKKQCLFGKNTGFIKSQEGITGILNNLEIKVYGPTYNYAD